MFLVSNIGLEKFNNFRKMEIQPHDLLFKFKKKIIKCTFYT
jgi:hypothetical protein